MANEHSLYHDNQFYPEHSGSYGGGEQAGAPGRSKPAGLCAFGERVLSGGDEESV
jgi:hypothetical protein